MEATEPTASERVLESEEVLGEIFGLLGLGARLRWRAVSRLFRRVFEAAAHWKALRLRTRTALHKVLASVPRPMLASLDISGCTAVPKAGPVVWPPALVELDVSRPLVPGLQDEVASHFARMLKVNTSLASLDLSKANVSDLGLQLLAESVYRAGPSSQLQVLKLQSNKIQLVDNDAVLALTNLLARTHLLQAPQLRKVVAYHCSSVHFTLQQVRFPEKVA